MSFYKWQFREFREVLTMARLEWPNFKAALLGSVCFINCLSYFHFIVSFLVLVTVILVIFFPFFFFESTHGLVFT